MECACSLWKVRRQGGSCHVAITRSVHRNTPSRAKEVNFTQEGAERLCRGSHIELYDEGTPLPLHVGLKRTWRHGKIGGTRESADISMIVAHRNAGRIILAAPSQVSGIQQRRTGRVQLNHISVMV